MTFSNADNGTFLDLPYLGPFGGMESICERQIYICYVHNLPNPVGRDHEQVLQLASLIEGLPGIRVQLPDLEIPDIMENIDEWCERAKGSEPSGVIVICSRHLVSLWHKAAAQESPSQRLAHHEQVMLKKVIGKNKKCVAPLVLDRCLQKGSSEHDYLPQVIRRNDITPFYWHLAEDRSSLWQWLMDISGGDSASVCSATFSMHLSRLLSQPESESNDRNAPAPAQSSPPASLPPSPAYTSTVPIQESTNQPLDSSKAEVLFSFSNRPVTPDQPADTLVVIPDCNPQLECLPPPFSEAQDEYPVRHEESVVQNETMDQV